MALNIEVVPGQVVCEFCGDERSASASFCRCGAALVRGRWHSPRRVRRVDVAAGFAIFWLVVAAIELAIVVVALLVVGVANR
jgi:hypothetical protein